MMPLLTTVFYLILKVLAKSVEINTIYFKISAINIFKKLKIVIYIRRKSLTNV